MHAVYKMHVLIINRVCKTENVCAFWKRKKQNTIMSPLRLCTFQRVHVPMSCSTKVSAWSHPASESLTKWRTIQKEKLLLRTTANTAKQPKNSGQTYQDDYLKERATTNENKTRAGWRAELRSKNRKQRGQQSLMLQLAWLPDVACTALRIG